MKKLLIIMFLLSSLIVGSTAASAKSSTFKDVTQYKHSWAIESIEFMSKKGIIKGYKNGTFKPDNNVTKAEFITMFSQLFDKYITNDDLPTRKFKDVPSSHWAYASTSKALSEYTYSTYAYKNGVNYFYPDHKLTRIGVVNLLPELYDEIDNDQEVYDILNTMKDIPKREYSDDLLDDGRYDYTLDGTNKLYPLLFDELEPADDHSSILARRLAALQKEGIMTTNEGLFNPKKAITRAEAATILHRLYLDLKEKGTLTKYSSK
ncbi:S-layer homology domain-containing protein [Paenibacillus sp. NPDC056933]|uniref:S-layer homology domain-containing protein n=1 Tax=Paenibacillus sp. NPDC056933 TaxID=3345968 RepID=UPI00362FC7D4